MIDKNDRLRVPKRLYIMDYQLEPCKIDGISDARLNAFPFNTTNGKLVEYLCLDTLWHPASEEPKKVKNLLLETTYEYGKPIYHLIKYMPNGNNVCAWREWYKGAHISRWLYIDDLLPKEGDEQ